MINNSILNSQFHFSSFVRVKPDDDKREDEEEIMKYSLTHKIAQLVRSEESRERGRTFLFWLARVHFHTHGDGRRRRGNWRRMKIGMGLRQLHLVDYANSIMLGTIRNFIAPCHSSRTTLVLCALSYPCTNSLSSLPMLFA